MRKQPCISQEDVIGGLLTGHTTQMELAKHLSVARSTLFNHLHRVYDNTNVHSIPDLILWALRNGYQLPQATGDD